MQALQRFARRSLWLVAFAACASAGAGSPEPVDPETGPAPSNAPHATQASAKSSGQAEGRELWEEYDKLIQKSELVGALGPDLFGDSVGFYNGALSFQATDVSLPGNSDLPVAFARSLTIDNTPLAEITSENLADWSLETPRLLGTFASPNWASRCSANSAGEGRPLPEKRGTEWFQPEDFWSGNQIVIPGRGSEEMLVATNPATPRPGTGGPYYWVTPGFTWFSCLPARKNTAGEAFVAITPDGTKYWFDWQAAYYETPLKGRSVCSAWGCSPPPTLARSRVALYATRVEDRFGNWVTYTYTNAANATARLSRIEASDGRLITVAYNSGGTIDSVTANQRTWRYQYSSVDPSRGTLSAVILPDGSRWTLNLAPLAAASVEYNLSRDPGDLNSTCLMSGINVQRPQVTGSITHPSGAVGEFTVQAKRFGRTNVPAVCANYQLPHNNPSDDIAVYPIRWDSLALIKKRITGPGLEAAEWNYSYSSPSSYFMHASGGGHPICVGNVDCSVPRCTTDSCAGASTTTVAGPAGVWQRHTFGNSYRYNEGKLLKIEQGAGPTAVLRTTTHTYNLAQSGQNYPTPVGRSPQLRKDALSAEYLLPQIAQTTVQDGVHFRWQVESRCGGALCLDAFARATSIQRSSTIAANPVRTDETRYQDFADLWVLGLERRKINVETGVVLSQLDFDARAQPVRMYRFGKLQQTLSYQPDGRLQSATDGNGNTTTLSDYQRGIPGRIRYADGTAQSASIDLNGWIRSVTDETGAKTCYGYDAMGRLSSIVYPAHQTLGLCDGSRWSPVSMGFQQIQTEAHGLPAGHWRLHRQEGNKHRYQYFDALWRPVLETSQDASDIAGTLQQVVKRYDAAGRTVFESYPSRGVGSFMSALPGTRSTYDALDRPLRQEQDSEQGVLVTSTEYQPGFAMRVTNPRGQQTRSFFFAVDSPRYEAPALVFSPEGQVTEIQRDVLERPVALIRRDSANTVSVARQYVYDGHGQLCKTIEPESGATVTGYDAAGNPTWQAAGLVGGSFATANTCSHSEAWSSGRRVDRAYDARNRLATLRFPNGLGDQTLSYEADGLPREITVYNGSNGTEPATTRYTYNARRLPLSESLVRPGGWEWRIGYEYDAIGNLRWLGYPTGLTLDFNPNALGQATQAIDTQGRVYASGARYYPNGALAQFTYGNGIVHSMTQNARQLASRVTSSGGVADYSYTYDAHANITAISDLARGTGFDREMRYDGLDRLISARSPAFGGSDFTHRFSYDALDNLRSWTLAGVKDYADYVYDASNRLSAIRSSAGANLVALEYDPQGNLKRKNDQTYGFDFGNRLRDVPTREHYRYDAAGRRILAWSPALGSLHSHYASSGQLLYQEDHRQAPVKASEHIHFAGSLIATRETLWGAATTVKYQHTDALGSPVAITNAAGQVLERMAYEPWGAVIGKPAHHGIGYTGHVMDGATTGLTYMQQRYYDQSIGRFLSVDSVAANPSTGGMFNRYNYANNNPYTYVDPDGRAACPGSSRMVCIQADSYEPNRSTGQTTQASEPVGRAMVDGKAAVAVNAGGRSEKIGFVVPAEGGGYEVRAADDATTSSTSRVDSASATIPEGAAAVLHGHIDGRTDGVVSPGDAGPLKQGLPNGVVSEGRVGVTEIVNGRLQFRMLEGRMTDGESRRLQQNLNKQQRDPAFMRPEKE